MIDSLFDETFLDGPDTTHFSYSLPVRYRATCSAGVVSADMAVMRACE